MEWSLSPDVVTKILLAVLLGGVIGFEREMHGRSAGLRTHMLVCLGAVLASIVGRYTASCTGNDPSRIAAGVITGVGFLGAGVIIRMEQGIRGLTTAACLWLVAALGVVIAFDLYAVAMASTAISVIVLFALSRLERILPETRSRQITVIFEGKPTETADLEKILPGCDCRVIAKSVGYDSGNNTTKLGYSVRTREGTDPTSVVEKLSSFENVKHVSWQ